jgi:tetratricopeptide (TPR) repeat protein
MLLRHTRKFWGILCFSFSLFSLLVVSIADAKIPDFLLKQKEAVVTIHVNDKNGNHVASGSGVVIGEDGIIATTCRLIVKWLEETENTLTVKTNNGSYPLDTLISYNSKLDVTLFTIEATGLPAANLDGGYKTGHERDSVVRYIVKSLERYRKTVKKGKDTHDVPEKLAKLGITPEEVKPIPDGAEAFLNRGCVYEASERYIEAIDAYVQAVRMKPDFSDAYVNLGLVYYRLARYPEAIEA